MKTTKNDHRVKYTQMVVREGLLKLVQEKPLNKITVAELCAVAQINRSTFYHHFYDVFDVYESIEDGFYNEVKVRLETIKVCEYDHQVFREIMLLIYRNADLVRIVLKNPGGSDCFKRIVEFIRAKFIADWTASSHIPEDYLKQVLGYLINGSLGLISDWIRSDMAQSLDAITDLVGVLNKAVLKVLRTAPTS